MSIGAIGAVPPGYTPATQVPQQPEKGGTELTTVTTQCDKEHWHTPSCPHTVSTRPAPESGQAGEYVDVWA